MGDISLQYEAKQLDSRASGDELVSHGSDGRQKRISISGTYLTTAASNECYADRARQ